MKYINDTNSNDPITGMMDTEHVEGFLGLTKREHLAAMAMQGLLANPNGAMQENNRATVSPSGLAAVSVAYADALITALNK